MVVATMYEFRCFCTLLKNAYQFHHIRPSIHYTRCISAVPTGRISVKFDIVIFYEKSFDNLEICLNRAENQAVYMTT